MPTLSAAPLFHITDACNTRAMTWAGGKHILIDRFDPVQVLEVIEHEKVTVVELVPTMWTILLSDPTVHQRDFSSLRLAISGGEPIGLELIRKIMTNFTCEYIQNYGMTESPHFLTISRPRENLGKLPQQEQLDYKAKTGSGKIDRKSLKGKYWRGSD